MKTSIFIMRFMLMTQSRVGLLGITLAGSDMDNSSRKSWNTTRVGLFNLKMRLAAVLFLFTSLAFVHSQDNYCYPPNGDKTCVCDTGSGIIDLTSISFSDGNAL